MKRLLGMIGLLFVLFVGASCENNKLVEGHVVSEGALEGSEQDIINILMDEVTLLKLELNDEAAKSIKFTMEEYRSGELVGEPTGEQVTLSSLMNVDGASDELTLVIGYRTMQDGAEMGWTMAQLNESGHTSSTFETDPQEDYQSSIKSEIMNETVFTTDEKQAVVVFAFTNENNMSSFNFENNEQSIAERTAQYELAYVFSVEVCSDDECR